MFRLAARTLLPTAAAAAATTARLATTTTVLPKAFVANNNNINNNYYYYHTTVQNDAKMTVEQLASTVDLNKQNVLVRVDLNAPLSKTDDTVVTDDTRLRAIVPTVQYLLSKNANVILCSHFGRPKGEIIETGKNGRLTPVVKPLETLLGVPIIKVNDTIGPDVEKVASTLTGGQVMLLENTRFYAGETKNDPTLSEGLSKLANYFVMDAFGTAHRAHSSTTGVCSYMKYNAAGYLMEKELKFLIDSVDTNPQRPLMSIVGGAKTSTKIPVIQSLINKCDTILVGGGMIFTFYKALGYDIGKSLVEDDMVQLASDLMKEAKEKNVNLILPTDVILADSFDNNANTAIAPVTEINGDWMGLDIGPETIELFKSEIDKAQTIVWNGPMGVFEMSNFATGTMAIAEMLGEATATRNAITIIGGGDSVAAVNTTPGLAQRISHISTGGGASLELLEGKVLPGVQALTEV
jgi:phosphoglycerate kinase